MKKLKPTTIVGLAMVIGGSLLMAVGLNALFATGTCASGGPYISANPCPPGTGGHILELMGGIFLAVIGIIMSGQFALAFGGFFTGVGAYSVIHVLTSDNLGSGAKLGGLIMGVTFLIIGVPSVLVGLGGLFDRTPERKPIDVNALTAGAQLRTAGAYGSYAPVAPTIIRPPGGATATKTGDAVDKLKELADLKDRGVLSDAEFQTEKAKLLSS
jgi:hypothetical protein